MKIEIDALSKQFGKVEALDHVSLEIPRGSIVAVLGLNGAGKTTLLRCLAGIVLPNSGRILYDGELFRRDRLDLRRRLMFLPDFPLLFSHMTPIRHIGMVLRLFGKEDTAVADRVVELLRDLDILALSDTMLGQLSRGQFYKVALATLLAVNPELWILDEPFASGMDPHGISYFKRQARAAAGRNATVVYSTQILDVAEKFSDLVCLLEGGRLRLFDSVANLRSQVEQEHGVLDEVFRQLREGDA